jgi:hypothetical protein
LTDFPSGATLSPYTATWSPAPIRKSFTAAMIRCASIRNSQIITLQSHPLHRCNHQINSQNLPLRQGHGRPSERCSGDHAKS